MSESKAFISDSPVFDREADKFNRWPFAQRVANTIAARMDGGSLVIAIYGIWGDGKTSVLNFIHSELSKNATTVPIRFNPWRFGDETSLLRYFFAEVAAALEASLTTNKEEIGKALSKYGAFLSLVSSGLAGAATQAGNLLADANIENEKARITEILKSNGKKIVVLMDDIDRLDKDEIQAVFRLIKLTADFENTVYVLAFDDEMVASALGERYTGESGNRRAAGREFIEKIVQVPLSLPNVPADALRRYSFESVDLALASSGVELTSDEVARFVQLFQRGVEVRLRTPRMAKRFANALAFGLAITKAEVNTVDMMLVEGIRVFYPNAYALIRNNKELLLSGRSSYHSSGEHEKKKKEFLENLTAGLNKQERESLIELLGALFPRMGGTTYGDRWESEWMKTKRIASETYFDRYFSYAIPNSDVSDSSIQDLLQLKSMKELQERLASLLNDTNAGSLVSKLRVMSEGLEEGVAAPLASAVALNGASFPRPEMMFEFQAPFSQAALLVHDLINRVGGERKYEIAAAAVTEALPLRFAVEIVNWVTSGKDTLRENRILSEQEDEKLWKLVAKRISEYALKSAEPIFVTSPKDGTTMLHIWFRWGELRFATDYLSQSLKQNPRAILKLLEGHLATSFSASGARPAKFMRETYNSVSNLLAPGIIFETLYGIFGEQLANPEYLGEGDFETRLAHQFAYIHQAIRKEQEQSAGL